MKNLKYLVLVALATPALAGSSAEQQYESIEQAYYHFDPKAYQSFSCHVDVTALDGLVANLKQIAGSKPGLLQVNDTLAVYTLNFDHKKGVSLTDPSLDLTILEEKLAADPMKLKQGIGQSKNGFNAEVQGVDKIITGLFEGYLDKGQMGITSVAHDGNKWIVKSTQEGASTIDTFDGSHVHTETNANGFSVISDSDYAPVNGSKPALRNGKIQMTQALQNVTSDLTVNYQTLGPLQVPASLVSKTTSGMAGASQTVSVTINFQNCSIKN